VASAGHVCLDFLDCERAIVEANVVDGVVEHVAPVAAAEDDAGTRA
jgi:hypothetical protein